MSVGNDVVDLADVESRLHGLHPRWAERVFAASERAELDASPTSERHRLHWALWAAKESAYKARKRNHREAVFSPGEFVVDLPPLPAADGIAAGRVVHRGEEFALEMRFDAAWVHAVATSADERSARAFSRVERARGEAGRAVRQLAVAGIGAALGLDPGRLEIAGRPPVVLDRSHPMDVILSLSHHGRFLAFACMLPSGTRTM